MTHWIVVCPRGQHPGNYETFGPFDGSNHARLWLDAVHAECEWNGEGRDFQTHNGHQLRRLRGLDEEVPA